MATTLTLGYAIKGSKNKNAQEHPACLIFPYRAGDHSILALSDTATMHASTRSSGYACIVKERDNPVECALEPA